MLTLRYWFWFPVSSHDMYRSIERRIANAGWKATVRVGASYVDVTADTNTHELIEQFVDTIASNEYQIETID